MALALIFLNKVSKCKKEKKREKLLYIRYYLFNVLILKLSFLIFLLNYLLFIKKYYNFNI